MLHLILEYLNKDR